MPEQQIPAPDEPEWPEETACEIRIKLEGHELEVIGPGEFCAHMLNLFLSALEERPDPRR